ncbi:hypothetical protein [Paenibacillus dendritiformis]|uniref:hypothetical protein n=1 Tax=Paenibacillus dendritiformis TaxID=130049 RepID=UPI00140AC3BF|nr:hypothetical protein [Paenibacillus dendritiformis]
MGMSCLPLYIIGPLAVLPLIVCHGIPNWQAASKTKTRCKWRMKGYPARNGAIPI